MKSEVETILNDAGIPTISGYDVVLDAIKKASDGKDKRLCSGYGVFPDGNKCKGCSDCNEVIRRKGLR